MSGMAVLAVVLLFMTQPPAFGQAFINPKVVLYMALFTLTAVLRFHAADRFLTSDLNEGT